MGNKNAKGNRGGKGGPRGNKKAVSTHEYETIYYDGLGGDEKRLVELEGVFHDEALQLVNVIKICSVREIRIRKDIDSCKNPKNAPASGEDGRPGPLAALPGETLELVVKLEDALTRVQAQRMKAVAQLHQSRMDKRRHDLALNELELKREDAALKRRLADISCEVADPYADVPDMELMRLAGFEDETASAPALESLKASDAPPPRGDS